MQLDDYDRKILNIIQSDYPIASRPYAVVGDKVGLSEGEVLARVNALRDAGVIRRIGANFNSPQLGWHSTLCAAKVPEDKLDEFVAEVNRHDNVTHNYLRAHEFNVWFTYIGESPKWCGVRWTRSAKRPASKFCIFRQTSSSKSKSISTWKRTRRNSHEQKHYSFPFTAFLRLRQAGGRTPGPGSRRTEVGAPGRHGRPVRAQHHLWPAGHQGHAQALQALFSTRT